MPAGWPKRPKPTRGLPRRKRSRPRPRRRHSSCRMTFECCAKKSTANPDSRIEESIMKNHLVPPLGQARIAYANAQANPQVTSLAAGELKQASDSLDKANNASSKGESSALVDHLAYVAKQQVAVAQETAAQKAAELLVANASAERDRVRLDARTREADSAQRSAAYAQRQAEASQRQAEASQRQSEASQRQSEASQRSAEASQRQS